MHIKSNSLWKILAPLITLGVLLLVPVPAGMPPQAWRYFAVFIAMIIGMILEPIPATAISFIAVTVCVIGSQYLLFDASELAQPGFNASKAALKWGLAGFSSTTVWLVFGAFIFALGYEVSGLGRRIALLLVKFMGKRTLTLGYAIVIIDVLLAPFTPSNTARTGGTVFPVIRNLPPLFQSFPNNPSARRIGGYLMWMMIISTSLSSSMFVTGAAPNVVGLGMAKEIGVEISWAHWFLGFLPVGIILLVIAPWLSYILYKPEITHSGEVTDWAGKTLKEMGALSVKETTLIGLVLLSLGLWVFGGRFIDATAVCLLAISLMLVLSVVHWKDVIHYSSAWNTLVNLATLVVMANGLKQSGFLGWFSMTMSAHLRDFSPDATVVVLVLVFYFSHYLFASLTAHTTTLMPVILAIGQSIPGINLQHLCMLLVFSIGIMGCLTPYATGPGVIIYNCGYVKSKDFWRLGAIFGVIFISTLLLVGWPILSLWS
ncbi:MAG: Citrate:succinate antiporter [Candidatus Tokpelaia hoelldobleri]|uniref:Citrate:succinate antiporter n=1 Tax=Candidatus Tokpelaia hoelldobleri TaxID=1902579 RepID=A0A1U9JT57_9HYPH|nr:MAG: Citrate:succinate antiporter [Candidatus Tokpelaia hoelldoblerii]